MSHRTHTEAGNAVTLTLLGLAVAILAGVAVLYVVGKQRPVPVPVSVVPKTVGGVTEEGQQTNPREGWRTYENTEYSVAFEYPDGWIVATGTVLGKPVITAYDAGQYQNASSTFGVHESDVRLSVYPQGLPLQTLSDEEKDSEIIVAVPGASAKDFTLGASKRAWATIARFDTCPASWTTDGMVFMRAHVEDEMFEYLRGDATITPEEYNAQAGDRMVRQGFVDPEKRAVEEEILRSFRFLPEEGVGDGTASGMVDMVQVKVPHEGDSVTSPLTVSGEARGNWYFEGSFPIELRTDTGEVLASVPAQAQSEWMTEDFVPFEVSLVFASTTATSGVLVLSRDNPSGLSTQDQDIKIHVRF